MRVNTALFLGLLFAARAAAAADYSFPQWQTIELGPVTSPYRFAFYSNHPLTGTHGRITQAVVIQHGLQRNGAEYFAAAARVMAQFHVDDAHTLLLAPQFLTAPDAAGLNLSGMPLWKSDGWVGGENAISTDASVSSLEVLDDLLHWLNDKQRFPALARILLAGHSAGAQLLQRYAVLNRAADTLNRAGIAVRYVIANPSSYLYFTEERPRLDAFARYDGAATCPGFNDFKYGFANPIRYAAGVDPLAAFERYAARDVVYLLGERDINPKGRALDRTCAAQAQGAYRLERGLAYLRYERHLARDRVKLAHRAYRVAGVGHDYRGMLGSLCGAEVIFGVRDQGRPGSVPCNEIMAARISLQRVTGRAALAVLSRRFSH